MILFDFLYEENQNIKSNGWISKLLHLHKHNLLSHALSNFVDQHQSYVYEENNKEEETLFLFFYLFLELRETLNSVNGCVNWYDNYVNVHTVFPTIITRI